MLTQDVLNLANDVAKTSLLNGARLKAIQPKPFLE